MQVRGRCLDGGWDQAEDICICWCCVCGDVVGVQMTRIRGIAQIGVMPFDYQGCETSSTDRLDVSDERRRM